MLFSFPVFGFLSGFVIKTLICSPRVFRDILRSSEIRMSVFLNQVCRNVSMCNGCSAVNGCRQNESLVVFWIMDSYLS